MKLLRYSCVGLAIVFGFLTIVASGPNLHEYTDISPLYAEEMIDMNPEVIVIDVRELSEFCDNDGNPPDGHIPDALNMPLNSGVLQDEFETLNKYAPTILVCGSGNRSRVAAQFLVDNGFTEIYNMNGGMLAWQGDLVLCD